MKPDGKRIDGRTPRSGEDGARCLLRELAAHLRYNRARLRDEWVTRILDAELLTAMNI